MAFSQNSALPISAINRRAQTPGTTFEGARGGPVYGDGIPGLVKELPAMEGIRGAAASG